MSSRRAGMTGRLILWLTGALVLLWVAAVGAGAVVMKEEFGEIFDSALKETSQRLMPLLVEDLFKRDPSSETRRVNAAASHEEDYIVYQLRDQDGTVLLHSHDASSTPFDAPLVPGFYDTATHRVFTEPAVSGTLFLQLADPLEHRQEALVETSVALFVPMLLLLPLGGLAIWLVVRKALAPIGALQSEISARDGGNLRPLVVDGLPRELEAIAGSVDRLLDRLRIALESEREFAANSAHELRTPIAGALAQTQRLMREIPDGPARTRAKGIEASLGRLSHLTEKLLQLARADAGVGLSREPVDLVGVARLVFDEFGRRADNAGRLAFCSGATTSMKLPIDVDAFGIALRNLIENALLHGDSSTPIVVSISDNRIAVRNGGKVIPTSQLSDLVKRFRRGGTEAGGTGLGLAITSALARQMGGSLELKSPATGQQDGFEASLVFSSFKGASEALESLSSNWSSGPARDRC